MDELVKVTMPRPITHLMCLFFPFLGLRGRRHDLLPQGYLFYDEREGSKGMSERVCVREKVCM